MHSLPSCLLEKQAEQREQVNPAWGYDTNSVERGGHLDLRGGGGKTLLAPSPRRGAHGRVNFKLLICRLALTPILPAIHLHRVLSHILFATGCVAHSAKR